VKYRLTITPAFEVSSKAISFEFEAEDQMLAAKDSCADLLLFIQDAVGAMAGYSNIFEMEELIDGEWEEYEEF